VSDYNHNTKKYTFAFPDKEAISGGGITHLLMIKAATEGAVVDDAGKEVARPYTPISSPDTVGKIDFLIKKYDVRRSFPFGAGVRREATACALARPPLLVEQTRRVPADELLILPNRLASSRLTSPPSRVRPFAFRLA
jgi:hypothetical protein